MNYPKLLRQTIYLAFFATVLAGCATAVAPTSTPRPVPPTFTPASLPTEAPARDREELLSWIKKEAAAYDIEVQSAVLVERTTLNVQAGKQGTALHLVIKYRSQGQEAADASRVGSEIASLAQLGLSFARNKEIPLSEVEIQVHDSQGQYAGDVFVNAKKIESFVVEEIDKEAFSKSWFIYIWPEYGGSLLDPFID